jgi:hypothetical protein
MNYTHSRYLIIVDGINEDGHSAQWSSSSFHVFNTQLVRLLSSTLPSVALQSGAAGRGGVKDAVALVNSNTPVIFLDLRLRKPGHISSKDVCF